MAADGVDGLAPDTLVQDTLGTVLEEMTVQTRPPDFVERGDTLIYRAENFLLPPGARLIDLIRMLPGAEIRADGNVYIRGERVDYLYIEGRKFRLADVAESSEMLPASIVSRLKVYEHAAGIDNLAAFERGDKERVLDLSLKEDMKAVLSNSLDYGVGRDLGHNGQVRHRGEMQSNLFDSDKNFMANAKLDFAPYADRPNGRIQRNYMLGGNLQLAENMDFSGSSAYMQNRQVNDWQNRNTVFLPDGERQTTDSRGGARSKMNSFSLNPYLNWTPGGKHHLSFSSGVSYSTTDTETPSQNLVRGIAGDTLSQSRSDAVNENKSLSFHFNLNYGYRFAKPRRVLTLSANGSYNHGDGRNRHEWTRREYAGGSAVRDTSEQSLGRSDNASGQGSLRFSYVEPFGEAASLQLIYKAGYSGSQSRQTAYSARDGRFRLNRQQSHDSKNDEWSQMASVYFLSKREKWDYRLGLTCEYSDLAVLNRAPSSRLQAPDYALSADWDVPSEQASDSVVSDIPQRTFRLTPVFQMEWTPRKNLSYRMAYNGKMQSPSGYQLRADTDNSDPMNTFRGNPDLKPSYLHTFSLSTFQGKPEGMLEGVLVELSGEYQMNDIQSVYTIDPATGHRFTTYANVDGNYRLNFSTYYEKVWDKARCWSSTFSAIGGYDHMKTIVNGEDQITDPYHLDFSASIKYHKKEFQADWEAGFRYQQLRGSDISYGGTHLRNWHTGGNINWSFLKGHYFRSDFSFTSYDGYGDGADYSRCIWNLSLTRVFFIGRDAIRVVLEGRDILPGASSNRRNISATGIRDTKEMYREQYFLCTLGYQFEVRSKKQR